MADNDDFTGGDYESPAQKRAKEENDPKKKLERELKAQSFFGSAKRRLGNLFGGGNEEPQK